jgi:hypothetical protein
VSNLIREIYLIYCFNPYSRLKVAPPFIMSSQFGVFIELEASSSKPSSSKPSRPELHRVPTAPEKAVSRTYHSVPFPQAPDALELDSLEWGAKPKGPSCTVTSKSGTVTPSGAQTPRTGTHTPRTPNDLEMSRSASPSQDEQDGVDIIQSFSSPPINRYRMISMSLTNLMGGLNDSSAGALIPYMEKYASFPSSSFSHSQFPDITT